MVQQLWRVKSQRQVSQKAELAQEAAVQKTRDVLDDHKGTKRLSKDCGSEDCTQHNKTMS